MTFCFRASRSHFTTNKRLNSRFTGNNYRKTAYDYLANQVSRERKQRPVHVSRFKLSRAHDDAHTLSMSLNWPQAKDKQERQWTRVQEFKLFESTRESMWTHESLRPNESKSSNLGPWMKILVDSSSSRPHESRRERTAVQTKRGQESSTLGNSHSRLASNSHALLSTIIHSQIVWTRVHPMSFSFGL